MALSRGRRRLVGRLRSRRTRERERLFLVEGVRSCEAALASGAPIRFAVASPRLRAGERGRRLAAELEARQVPVEWVEDGDLDALSDTETPQGVLLVCPEPEAGLASLAGPGRYLLMDGVQDPGNVGTLVRAAAAFGLDGVVALDGTADPWNAKAVRATAGAAFRVPVVRAPWSALEDWLRGRRVPVLVADPRGTDVAAAAPRESWALVVGSEGSGPRPQVLEAADLRVSVPMPGGGESLNAGVAGAILLYALTREAGRA